MQRSDRHRLHAWHIPVAALIFLLGPVVAGCGEDDPKTPASGTEDAAGAAQSDDAQAIEVVIPGSGTGEYSFEADLDGISAGPVTVSLTNNGRLEHQAHVMKLNEGETLDSVMAAAQDPTGAKLASLVVGYGGLSAAPPGGTTSATQVLDAGEYLLICVIPGEDALPHFAHGMVEQFTVAEANGEVGSDAEIDADAADVRLKDFSFTLQPLEAGQEVTVLNEGEQPHELVAVRPEEGVTQDDIAAALSQPPGSASGPPPWAGVGGIGVLAPGRSGSFTLPDEPGDYVFICMVPDVAGDGLPHLMHGMIQTITVS